MATVTVTKQFAEDFKLWSDFRVSEGEYTPEEMEQLKAQVRAELAPGPDQFRKSYSVLTELGVEIPAAIDDQAKRVALWAGFFADEADQIRNLRRKAA